MGQSVINYFCAVLADKGLKDSKQLQPLYIWKLFATGDGLDKGCILGERVQGEKSRTDVCLPPGVDVSTGLLRRPRRSGPLCPGDARWLETVRGR